MEVVVNINRLRPTGVEDLALWLSGVVNDAIRDVREAGLDETSIYLLLKKYAETNHPYGYRNKDFPVAHTQPATLFEIRALDNKSKGTLLIADFNETRGKPAEYMATLATPPLVATGFAPPNEYRTQSAAVRAVADQVKSILDQLGEIARTLEANGK
jgi:hypothetical protein